MGFFKARLLDFTLIGVAAVGIMIMISVGNTVVKEYNIGKHYVPTSCSYLTRSNLGFRTCNSCDNSEVRPKRSSRRRRNCHTSSYPCVQILVTCHDNLAYNSTAIFYPDAFHAIRSTMCSYYVCSYGAVLNEQEVQKFVDGFTSGKMHSQFPCYRDRNRPGHVIGRKIFTYEAALHGMLWPALAVAVCLIILALRQLKGLRDSRRNNYSTTENLQGSQVLAGSALELSPAAVGPDSRADFDSSRQQEKVGYNSTSAVDHAQATVPGPANVNSPTPLLPGHNQQMPYPSNMTGYPPAGYLATPSNPGPVGYPSHLLAVDGQGRDNYSDARGGGNMMGYRPPNIDAPPPDYHSAVAGGTTSGYRGWQQ